MSGIDDKKNDADRYYQGDEILGHIESIESPTKTQTIKRKDPCKLDLSHLRCILKHYEKDNECIVYNKNLSECKKKN